MVASRITLRAMTADDLPLLYEWLNRPHVAEWWGDAEERASLESVSAALHPSLLAAEKVVPYIGLLDDAPFAYAQSYTALGSGDGWWEDERDPGVRGIDQFIADGALLGQGLGTQLVQTLVEHLFLDPSVTRVQVDPAPENRRAIRCYARAGFRLVATIATPDGPAAYMVRDRGAPKDRVAAG